MLSDARHRLAQQQSAMVRALNGAAPDGASLDPADDGDALLPVGVDVGRLRVLAQSLARKRAEAVARIWPDLPKALGAAEYGRAFHAYAAARSIPAEGGTTADGRAFIAWYASRHSLPDELRCRALLTDLALARSREGLRRRRGVALRLAWLRDARRLAVGLRLPWLGIVWGSMPVGRPRRRR